MTIPYTEGWPADRGPLKTLRKAGLLGDDGNRPAWLHHDTAENWGIYRATAPFMSNVAIRHLAALSLEGWDVHIKSTDAGLSIRVKPRK